MAVARGGKCCIAISRAATFVWLKILQPGSLIVRLRRLHPMTTTFLQRSRPIGDNSTGAVFGRRRIDAPSTLVNVLQKYVVEEDDEPIIDG